MPPEVNKHVDMNAKRERKLAENEKYCRMLLETPGFFVVIIDEQGRILEVNSTAGDILGYAPSQLSGQSIFDFLDESDRKRVQQHLADKSTFSQAESSEYKFRNRNGDVIEIIANFAVVPQDTAYPPVAMIGFDLTKYNQHVSLVQRDDKFRALSLLARYIAHELNNILTVLMGNAALLKMYVKDDEKLLRLVSKIEGAGQKASDLSKQLAIFAKGTIPEFKIDSLPALIQETVQSFDAPDNIRLEITIAPELYPVKMDAAQIRQVINNLLNNAREAMPEGGVIRLEAENLTVTKQDNPLLMPGDYVKIAVHDQGKGISAELRARIFEPYFTTKDKGRGLGLANSYTIIKNHHGLLTFESRNGEGTTFFLYLPAMKAHQIQT